MTRVTKFAGRDPGPAARMAGFIAHLRENGLRLGVAEADTAMTALTHVDATWPDQSRRALKAVCTGCKDEAERFDALFDAFWLDAGRVRTKTTPTLKAPNSDDIHSSRQAQGQDAGGAGQSTAPDGGDGEADADGEGKLIATKVRNLMRKDLRDMVRPEDIAEAEEVARRLGAALRDRRSRRRIAARKGDRIHFRKTIRASLATGGEPVKILRKKRPDRTRKIVALCDVSGSMTVYAQVFMAFLAGLMRADTQADAYLFHTRLVRITEALRDRDAMRAIGRMSLMADGFGGGSNIGPSLERFADTYAKRFVDGRSVVMILSDGYDTAPPAHISAALAKIKKRGARVIWLNPLKGWADYAPVATGMAAALPHLDLFKAANTLGDLAALDRELAHL
ncbi:carbon monoxide dehydrogenase [Thalassobacter stenotrophicus]|uniref:vWA domain-containing protein n=1 Tax=Thalassobacter TaxID=266808 RepID=UPI00051D59CD|nr:MULTISPECIES: VWA domain-containing protein [Thalassobacter]KGK79480.1 carbon monoxide dehydrogenase [Thalassobacter stenotrophicus]KGL01576.1 carbon monoxide dehydrogenase [Thalassobacter sp. 16PALIMAR09]